jgi:hypothetical protein
MHDWGAHQCLFLDQSESAGRLEGNTHRHERARKEKKRHQRYNAHVGGFHFSLMGDRVHCFSHPLHVGRRRLCSLCEEEVELGILPLQHALKLECNYCQRLSNNFFSCRDSHLPMLSDLRVAATTPAIGTAAWPDP